MKSKKRLILTFACAAAISATAFGVKFADANKVKAAEWQDVTLEESYAYGATVQIPERTIQVGDKHATATAYVTFPDGTVTSASSITTTVFGEYTVNYYAELDGKHYGESLTFTVYESAYAYSLPTSSAEYGHYDKYGADTDGLMVRLANKDKLTFTNLIDVTNITKSDPLVEAFITPDQQGTPDFSRLIFTLTDSEDDSVYLNIHVNRYVSDTVGFGVCFAMAGGNGQDMVGYEANKGLHVNDGIGAAMNNVSFRAQDNKDGWRGAGVNKAPDRYLFNVAYDASTNSAYAQNTLIADMDDAAYYKKLWYGFPSGKVRLSVSAAMYSASTANFCITSVAGTSLQDLISNDFSDTEGPKITVDTEYTEMPLAEVGTAYAVPTATARDEYSGKREVNTAVYYEYGSETPVSVGVANGKFTPSKPGYYAIVYTACDAYGNESTTVKYVRAVKNAPAVSAEVPSDAQKTAHLGVFIEVDDPTLSGGSGNLTVVKTVTFDGEVTEIEDGFVPQKAGKYTVTYTVTDYLGKTVTCGYDINATYSGSPVFANGVTLPKIFISDAGYVLPELYADDYATGSHKTVLADVKVEDANGTKVYKAGSRFVPKVANDGDKVKITYYSGSTTLEAVEIPAIKALGYDEVYGVEVYGYKYFYGNTEMTYKDENGANYRNGGVASVITTAGKSGWTFANPLVAENFSLEMSTISGLTKFSAFEIVFTDAADYSKSAKVTITASSTKISHGGKEYKTAYSLTDGKRITVGYSGGTVSLVCDSSSVYAPLGVYEDGMAFAGFPSGKVYLTVNVLGGEVGGRYKVESINSNMFSYMDMDTGVPSLVLTGDYGGTVKKGQTFTTNIAEGADVLAPETSVSLTAYDPDGNVLKDVKGKKLENVATDTVYTIKTTKYGRYKVVYTIKEMNWTDQENEFEVTYDVPDDVPPTIKFTNKGTTEAKVGDVLVMPDFKVTDNLVPSNRLLVWTYVINPYGQIIELGDANSIIAKYKGEYTFVVYAQDVVMGETAADDTPNNASVLKWVVTVR